MGLTGFFDPTGETIVERKRLAPRVDTLAGKTVGLLINTKIQAEPLLRSIQQQLQEGYKVYEFREARTNSTRPAPPETIEALAKCDVVINAVGD